MSQLSHFFVHVSDQSFRRPVSVQAHDAAEAEAFVRAMQIMDADTHEVSRRFTPQAEVHVEAQHDRIVCQACPAADRCAASRWNEGHSVIPSKPPYTCGVSMVHTCVVCERHTISVFDQAGATEVPYACPRWDNLQASACACADCAPDHFPRRR